MSNGSQGVSSPLSLASARDGAGRTRGAWSARAAGEQHTLPTSIALHLLPGALVVLFYAGVGIPVATRLGLPPLAGLLLAVLAVLLPVELGYLGYLGLKRNGRLSLEGVVLYRERVPGRLMARYVAVLFAWTVLSNAALAAVDRFLFTRGFSWLPEWFLLDLNVDRYARPALVATLLASLLVSGIAAPVAEELYFRGYLLPRLARLGGWAPVVHTILFALYHFWTPWLAVTRIIFFLPTVYAVWSKQSIAIAIWVHCLGNTVGTLAMLAAVLAGYTP